MSGTQESMVVQQQEQAQQSMMQQQQAQQLMAQQQQAQHLMMQQQQPQQPTQSQPVQQQAQNNSNNCFLHGNWTLETLSQSQTHLPNNVPPISPFSFMSSPMIAFKQYLRITNLYFKTINILSLKEMHFTVSKDNVVNVFSCLLEIKKECAADFLEISGQHGIFFSEHKSTQHLSSYYTIVWTPDTPYTQLKKIAIDLNKDPKNKGALGLTMYQGRSLGIRIKKESETNFRSNFGVKCPTYFEISGISKENATSFDVEFFFDLMKKKIKYCYKKKREESHVVSSYENLQSCGSVIVKKITQPSKDERRIEKNSIETKTDQTEKKDINEKGKGKGKGKGKKGKKGTKGESGKGKKTVLSSPSTSVTPSIEQTDILNQLKLLLDAQTKHLTTKIIGTFLADDPKKQAEAWDAEINPQEKEGFLQGSMDDDIDLVKQKLDKENDGDDNTKRKKEEPPN